MAKKDEVVYVGIEEPVPLRRTLLESSKSLVQLLKGQQNVEQIRDTKQRAIEELRSMLTQITELVVQAKQLMPQADTISIPVAVEEVRPPKVEKANVKPQATGAKKTKPLTKTVIVDTHVDKLERDLREIEKKLKSL